MKLTEFSSHVWTYVLHAKRRKQRRSAIIFFFISNNIDHWGSQSRIWSTVLCTLIKLAHYTWVVACCWWLVQLHLHTNIKLIILWFTFQTKIPSQREFSMYLWKLAEKLLRFMDAYRWNLCEKSVGKNKCAVTTFDAYYGQCD